MTALAATAAAIAARISSVSDTGVVYDHQPMPSTDWSAFVESFTAEIDGRRQVRAWTVQYLGEERTETTVAIGNAKQRRSMRFVARAHYGWNDAETSEADFRAQVEAVADAIDAERSIGPCYDHDPVDVDVPNGGAGLVLGDVLCHFAELTVVCQVEQTLVTT